MTGIYGVGYNSGGVYKTHCKEDGLSAGRSRAYIVWRSILMRCYSNKHHTTHICGSTYNRSYVCDEWKDFQKFAEWFYSNYVEGFDIDKDILFEGNEEYSPMTCVFVPKTINSYFKKKIKTSSGLPLGVYKQGSMFSIAHQLSSKFNAPTSYPTIHEAETMYKRLKGLHIRQSVDEYRDFLPDNLVDRLDTICKSFGA